MVNCFRIDTKVIQKFSVTDPIFCTKLSPTPPQNQSKQEDITMMPATHVLTLICTSYSELANGMS